MIRESTIWVVFTSRNGAAIPVCYRVSQADASDIVRALNTAAKDLPENGFFWATPVADEPVGEHAEVFRRVADAGDLVDALKTAEVHADRSKR